MLMLKRDLGFFGGLSIRKNHPSKGIRYLGARRICGIICKRLQLATGGLIAIKPL